MSCGCGYFGGEIECDSKESGMVFGATAKRMHKSTVAAGQSREQEGRQDSRASGRSLLDRRERKMNLSVRKRETRLAAAASGRRSLSPLSPFRFYDRRRDPRSLPPSLPRSPSLARRVPAQFVFTKWGSILSPSLLVSTESGRPVEPVERPATLRHAFLCEVACSRAQLQRKVTFLSP